MSHPLELIHEHRKELLAEINRIREDRKNKPARFKKPCVYVAMLSRPPMSRANPNPQLKPIIKTINLHGGRNKPSAITNMLRRGQFPVAYDFPTDETLKALKDTAKNTSLVTRDVARYVAEGQDPWAATRKFLDATIRDTLGAWQAADYKETSELEKKALKEENEALKAEIEKRNGEVPKKKDAPQKKADTEFESESEEELKKELEKSKK